MTDQNAPAIPVADYAPPAVWTWNQGNGGRFAVNVKDNRIPFGTVKTGR